MTRSMKKCNIYQGAGFPIAEGRGQKDQGSTSPQSLPEPGSIVRASKLWHVTCEFVPAFNPTSAGSPVIRKIAKSCELVIHTIARRKVSMRIIRCGYHTHVDIYGEKMYEQT